MEKSALCIYICKIALYQQKLESDKESGVGKRIEAYAPSALRKADIKLLKEKNLDKNDKGIPTLRGKKKGKVLISKANEIENGVNCA